MSYIAPVKDMLFVLEHLAHIGEVAKLPGFEDAGLETAQAVLEECAKFNQDVVAPLNWSGDQAPSSLSNGVVTTSAGFKAAFKHYGEGGWQGIQHPTEFGGQGLPKVIGTPCIEMLNAANMSFALCPLLTDGAIEALLTAGTDSQKDLYLPRLISGEWTGTMNLTEPQAGSDLALVRSKATREADGSYRIFGQKIFITFGEHDMAENLLHLVLARTPDAPEGVKGISLFLVPKRLVNPDGTLGARNDVWCQSLEHKLGIKASPTAVLLYGDDKGDVGKGAIGHLIGEENRGLEYMFIMMNAARFAVGIQGISVSERAYQKAVQFAKDRVQSRDVAGSAGSVSIIHHPDVRRMLMSMRAQIEASRALAYVAASASDAGHCSPDAQTRAENMSVYEYLVPVVKGWSTELSLEVTSLGVQIHGGMGFIEETGAAQYYRDARILTIYEGTTAIQANDLIGRKTSRDGGKVAKAVLAQVRATEQRLAASSDVDLQAIHRQLVIASAALEDAIEFIVSAFKSDVRAAFAGSVPYLKLTGIVLGGWQMARAALVAQELLTQNGVGLDSGFLKAKMGTARFFADHVMTQAAGLRSSIVEGSAGVMALSEAQF
jgi:3-(methylthio)propanoyl-CoA dehydrogenase